MNTPANHRDTLYASYHYKGADFLSTHGTVEYAPPTSPTDGTIGAQPLRASPIQDIPIERQGSNPAGMRGRRRPDVLARINHGSATNCRQHCRPWLLLQLHHRPDNSGKWHNANLQASGTMSAPQTPSAYSIKPIENEEDNTENAAESQLHKR